MHRKTKMKSIQNTTIEQIKKLRMDGLSLNKIAILLNIGRKVATKYSKEIILSDDMKYRIRADGRRTYDYNTSVFTNEDAISYYLLGAFMTDGCVRKAGNRTQITSADEDWLESMRNLISPNKPLNHRRNCYEYDINNRDICEWLMKHGCLPHKSITLKFPIIPKQYLIDFIRGCWDGDGCLCIYNDKKINKLIPSSYIVSASKEFIEEFSISLLTLGIGHSVSKIKLRNSKINERIIVAKHNLFRIKLSIKDTYKLCNTIYYPNCFCLERKQKKAKDISELINSRQKITK